MTRDGGGDEITMLIEDIREITSNEIGGATDHAEDSKTTFAGVSVGVGDFSTVPMAQEFGRQHQAAHEVFRSTISGVLADLEDFRTKLLACADSHEATDDSVRAGLLRMSSRYRERELRSQRNFDHGRREHSKALDPQHAGGGATSMDSGAHRGGGDHGSDHQAGHGTGSDTHGGESYR